MALIGVQTFPTVPISRGGHAPEASVAIPHPVIFRRNPSVTRSPLGLLPCERILRALKRISTLDFDMLGLPARLSTNLTDLGITEPTPIQKKAIPLALEGRDVLGLAQTGTGKTAAFALPMLIDLRRMEGKPAPKSVRALVLAPTRELAKQIQEAIRDFANGTSVLNHREIPSKA
mgnify:CR=1 FL=1